MICYKGNSFFRNIKILIKDFGKKAKNLLKKSSIFYEKRHEILLFLYKKKKYLYKKKKRLHGKFCIKRRDDKKNNMSSLKALHPLRFSSHKNSHNTRPLTSHENTEGIL